MRFASSVEAELMRNRLDSQFCPLGEVNVDLDVKVAPRNPRKDEGRLRDFDNRILVRRMQVVDNLFDVLAGLVLVVVKADEHRPPMHVFDAFVFPVGLGVRQFLVGVSKGKAHRYALPAPQALFY